MSETLDELDQVEVGDELNEIAGRVQKLLQATEQLVPVRVGQFFISSVLLLASLS